MLLQLIKLVTYRLKFVLSVMTLSHVITLPLVHRFGEGLLDKDFSVGYCETEKVPC